MILGFIIIRALRGEFFINAIPIDRIESREVEVDGVIRIVKGLKCHLMIIIFTLIGR